MGLNNEDSFGWTDYASTFGNSEPTNPGFAVGAGLYIEVFDIEPLIYGTAVYIPFKAGSTQFAGMMTEDQPNFLAIAGGFFAMGNLIQRAVNSNLNVTNLAIADETGQSDCTWVAPTGHTIQMQGLSPLYQEHTSDFSVPTEQSFSMHTNRGAAAAINATLPSGARTGTIVALMRMGPQLNVRTADVAEKFWHPASGFYKPVGQSIFMTASGTSAFFVKGSNSDWMPTFVAGTLA
jgi:hypothetical protein